jgi:hypothetical protein
MRTMIRLAGGLAAATLLLLAGASVAFAADPLVTIDGSAGTSSDATAVVQTGSSSGTVTLGAGAPTTGGGADGSATVTLGAGAPTTADGADGSATVTLGAGAPTTADGADGSATVTLGAGAPNPVGDPSSSLGALSSGFASLLAFGDTAAGGTTGGAPGAPATDAAFAGTSQAVGNTLASFGFGGAPGVPDEPGGSGGSGSAAADGRSSAGTLPETSMEGLVSGRSSGFPILALLVGLLAGGLVARRRSVKSAS